jgi:hypothetical protein
MAHNGRFATLARSSDRAIRTASFMAMAGRWTELHDATLEAIELRWSSERSASPPVTH